MHSPSPLAPTTHPMTGHSCAVKQCHPYLRPAKRERKGKRELHIRVVTKVRNLLLCKLRDCVSQIKPRKATNSKDIKRCDVVGGTYFLPDLFLDLLLLL